MTVRDYLKTLPEGTEVKLGGSCNFIYCGPVTEWLEDYLMIETQNELGRIKRYLGSRFTYLCNFDGFWEKALERRIDAVKKKWGDILPPKEEQDTKLYKVRKAWERDRQSSYEATLKSIKAFEARRDYIPFSIPDREVIETYDSIDVDNGVIVLFDGEWFGKFWTASEFNRDKYARSIITQLKGERHVV